MYIILGVVIAITNKSSETATVTKDAAAGTWDNPEVTTIADGQTWNEKVLL
jgi:hypothetical protein